MGQRVVGPLYLQRIATYLPTYNAYLRDEEYQHISIESGYKHLCPLWFWKEAWKRRILHDDVARLHMHPSDNMVLAGDFNCVLTPSDCTGSLNVSGALTRLVTGLDLMNVWDVNQGRMICTHYTAQGASRLDRIYLSRQLLKSKHGVELIAAAFTVHPAVILRVSLSAPCPTRGKDYWRINPTYLDDQHFLQTFIQHWERKNAQYYPSRVMWWCRFVKWRIRLLFSRVGVERCREREIMEHFYYSALYNVLQVERDSGVKTLKH
jgi:hypothetical protein